MIPCAVYVLLQRILGIYVAVLVIYAVVSWIPSLRGRWTDYVAMLVEPVLMPLRRVIPPLGGLDISFLVLILVVQWLSRVIVPASCYF
ncbi:MAG TPA: YggT family protein [Candidatus Acidoferrales bacterium]|nr:YggT family protein [Candidatus Acidoferrales bacterium]